MNGRTKSISEVVVTSYGRNKNFDDEVNKTKRSAIITRAIDVLYLKKAIKIDKNSLVFLCLNNCSKSVRSFR